MKRRNTNEDVLNVLNNLTEKIPISVEDITYLVNQQRHEWQHLSKTTVRAVLGKLNETVNTYPNHWALKAWYLSPVLTSREYVINTLRKYPGSTTREIIEKITLPYERMKPLTQANVAYLLKTQPNVRQECDNENQLRRGLTKYYLEENNE